MNSIYKAGKADKRQSPVTHNEYKAALIDLLGD